MRLILSILLVAWCFTNITHAQSEFGRDMEPSKAEAKKMRTLTEKDFSKGNPSPVYLHDVVYRQTGDMDLHLQIMLPDFSRDKKWPCIIYIQGSAWFKQDCYAKVPTLLEFSKRGYVIGSVEYHPSTVAAFPAQIQDVKTAVRFMRKNADKYGVDVNNIFIWGDSSGGNMSLLETLTQDVPELDTDEYGTESLAVNACMAYYPVTDVVRIQEFAPEHMDHISADSPTGVLFGRIPVLENADKVKIASPVIYVSPEKAATTSPILIMTGNRDRVLPFEQSVIMADKLEECGYNYTFYKIEGADHGSWEFWTPEVLDIVDNFLKSHIR